MKIPKPRRHPLIASALGHVRRHLAALQGSRHILVACSGGPDSVALLGLLHTLQASERLEIHVGHIDHGLRAASTEEARGVAQLAADLHLPCSVRHLDLPAGAALPARAREARRAALEAMAAIHSSPAIAVGHTATDQAETLLLHVARGAGLEGLAAMAVWEPRSNVDGGWWRPLLGLTRAQTRELAVLLGLRFFEDPTNEERKHPRVAIRAEVLPVLRRFRPHAEVAMAATAERVREAHEALQWMVERECTARRRDEDWSLVGITTLPRALRTAWLREVCRAEGIDLSALGRRTLEAIDRALCGGVGGQRGWDLCPGRRLWIESERLWVTTSGA